MAEPSRHALLVQELVEHMVEALVPVEMGRQGIATACMTDTLGVCMPECAGRAPCLCVKRVPDMPAMALPVGLAIGPPGTFGTSDSHLRHDRAIVSPSYGIRNLHSSWAQKANPQVGGPADSTPMKRTVFNITQIKGH